MTKVHHQIRLRILSCSRVSENHRGPEVPEVKVQVVECRDGLARITSEELAITHPAKDGILQNVCSTRARMVAVLGRSAHSHIVRLTHGSFATRRTSFLLWFLAEKFFLDVFIILTDTYKTGESFFFFIFFMLTFFTYSTRNVGSRERRCT